MKLTLVIEGSKGSDMVQKIMRLYAAESRLKRSSAQA